MSNLPPQYLEQIHNSLNQAFDYCTREDKLKIEKLEAKIHILERCSQEDHVKITNLENEILNLKQTIESQQKDIEKLKQETARGANRVSISPKRELSAAASYELGDNAPGKTKCAIENVHLLPTQYSDTEDEVALSEMASSPVKIDGQCIVKQSAAEHASSPINVSPKRRLSSIKTSSSPGTTIKLRKLNDHISGNGIFKIKSEENKLSSLAVDLELKQDLFNNRPGSLLHHEQRDESPLPLYMKRESDEVYGDVEEIADSQEDDAIYSTPSSQKTSSSPIVIPKHLNSVLQTRQYLTQYYTDKFVTDPSFKINLSRHPIKRLSWDFSDFKLNLNYQPGNFSQFIRRHNIMDKTKFDKYKTFYKLSEDQQFEDKLSQIFDKFESPPGFMKSEFPDTQELQERKKIVRERQSKRINRRLESCTIVIDQEQIGEFVFSLDILNRYVVHNRWYRQPSR
ncbi:hypothetical protein KGF56_001260 [Candida oxycetoniae]|uniref:Uncharacterized protein n=1 Tax=Candida oxycetoniae TaxID=497107 RepID=A0AAI9WZ49_9ASCO|nr:uncharacterized protein KGF56_001260 [Candida oxycetoniae]KAI3406041.2 hypothetical protein KGF56_001260 [Candida oxycetoniae]